MSTIIDPIAEAIADIAGALTDVTAYQRDPGMAGLEGNPAIVVGIPSIDRGDLDADSQIGSRDWFLDYPVRIYVDLDVPSDSQALLQDTVEAFILAVDGDDQLSASSGNFAIYACRVLEVLPGEIVGENTKPRLFADCRVRVQALVPQ